tara:strand:+ start:91 stop:1131 length:1041 start_codon:yes stop_codon:yes gene_type:complete
MSASHVLVQLGFALLLCLIATLQPLLMEVAKRGNGGHAPFHTPSAVFYTEAVKLVIALGVWAAQTRHLEYTGLESLRASTVLAYAVPAALFAVQNNLVYFAMQLLDPPTFQLWACFKLIPVGVFSSLLLARRLSAVQWAALVLLALGMANTTLDCKALLNAAQGGGGTTRQTRGITILVFNGCLSGLSTVANEWLIKFQDPRAPLMFKNLMIYTFGCLLCVGSWQPKTAPQFTSPLVLTIILTNAAAGLCVSLVLKYCDSLVKGFSTSVSVILAMMASSVMFGFELTRPFAVGSAVVCCAFYLYFGDFNKLLLKAAEARHEEAATELLDNSSETEAAAADQEKGRG